MNNIAIQFKNVTKVYKLFKNDKQRFRAIFSKRVKPKIKKAINEVSFTVERGESVALFGRNGAGKSTILKMITGVTYPTTGDIFVEGRVSALLELTAGFDPDFTGRENIFFRGQLLGISNDEIKELEEDIIEFADLGDYMDQPVRTYSSGMKARLGFAINANIKPEILIVDEALSVGDKEFRRKCRQKINEIVDDGDVTFLFVTHSTNVAKDFCKRGIVMKAGKLIYDGDIEDAIAFYEDMTDKEMAAKKKQGSKKILG
ncbi:Teichoic acids export ATP-binding protein TagH [uncultured Eubacterium sp.]|nr:Teichoic acids export ATP-binding protein TagH [uncultured Eubacterium sp.]